MHIHRIAVVYDVPGWAYERRANALLRYAPMDFQVDTCAVADESTRVAISGGNVDLVFLLDYSVSATIAKWCREAKIPIVVSHNSGPLRRREWLRALCRAADYVICNNVETFEGRSPGCGNCCAIPNGVDTEVFRPLTAPHGRPDRCLWCGAKAKTYKGWLDVIEPLRPLAEAAGFECDFRLVRNRDDYLDLRHQVEWYNNGAYILSAATEGHEGTPNTILEGVACGCVAVSTRSGNINEWGVDRQNCVLSCRSPQAFLDALCYARDHRSDLAEAGQSLICSQWSYRVRAPHYFALFRKILQHGATSVRPFRYDETPPLNRFDESQ